MVVIKEGGKRTTVSYPKWLVQERLGRLLKPDESVHHKDGDPLNNKEDNLEVLTQSRHAQLHSKPKEVMEFTCPYCGDVFQKDASTYRNNQVRQGKAGPFCGKRCAGKFSVEPG